MNDYPDKLNEYLEFFSTLEDRAERIAVLTDFANRFEPVPDSVACRPYAENHRVEFCDSEVYLWVRERPEGGLKFYFAVENPQGIAAMATVAILDECLSGTAPEKILNLDPEIVLRFFAGELSTRKRIGLMQIVHRIQRATRHYLETGDVQ